MSTLCHGLDLWPWPDEWLCWWWRWWWCLERDWTGRTLENLCPISDYTYLQCCADVGTFGQTKWSNGVLFEECHTFFFPYSRISFAWDLAHISRRCTVGGQYTHEAVCCTLVQRHDSNKKESKIGFFMVLQYCMNVNLTLQPAYDVLHFSKRCVVTVNCLGLNHNSIVLYCTVLLLRTDGNFTYIPLWLKHDWCERGRVELWPNRRNGMVHSTTSTCTALPKCLHRTMTVEKRNQNKIK